MIKYVYVRDFEWSDFEFKVNYQAHPRKGRVYRAEYDEKTSSHTLSVEELGHKRLMFETIQTKEDGYSYKADMVELTTKNILDFDIHEEDLNKIINSAEMEAPQNLPVPMLNLFNVIMSQQQEEEELAKIAGDRIKHLSALNTVQAELILDIMDYLIAANTTEDIAADMEIDHQLGKGMNISHALRNLSDYISKDRTVNDFEESLYEAITGVVRELERRRLWDLE